MSGDRSRRSVRWAARHPGTIVVLAVLAVVGFAFWKPLFAGGSLVPSDLLEQHVAPFNADRPHGFVAETASGDILNIHSHWTMLARDLRGGWSWWTSSLGLGYPVMKGGFPVFAVAYLFTPSWYAAGLMAVLRTLTAWGLTYGWLRTFELRRRAAFAGGAAFAFSGFVVGWGGWPHANVAALAPGALWALERLLSAPSLRRAVPLGMFGAAMIWANFPLVLLYLGIGGAAYLAARLLTGRDITEAGRAARRLVAPLVATGLIVVGLAGPHLVHFSERIDWGDTTYRQFSRDSSAGIEYLLTTVAPAAFGSDPVGPAWWGAGNWLEFQIHIGAPVVLLAAFAGAATTGTGPLARRRRGAVRGLWAMVGIGAVVGYVGGPPTDLMQGLIGYLGGLATRAKVLMSLGAAALAAFGMHAWLDDSPSAADAIRRSARRAAIGAAAVTIVMTPPLLDWVRDLDSRGLSRSTTATLVVPAATAVAVVAALVMRGRGRLGGGAFAALTLGAMVIELLAFAMPVPTVVDRSDRLTATASHALVRDLLGPGERLAGEGNTFFPNSTQLFEIDDLGGDVLKSPGYQSLLGDIDPRIFQNAFGGTDTYPSIPKGTDPTLPVWDALGIGVWAQFPDSLPPGPVTDPPAGERTADPSLGPITGRLVVPEGGLRALLVEIAVAGPSAGIIELDVEVGDEVLHSSRRRDELVTSAAATRVFPVVGEHLSPGAAATVTIRSDGDPGALQVGIADGALVLGHVAGADDGLRLVGAGEVTVLERANAAPVRLRDSAIVEPDPTRAAAFVTGADPVTVRPVVVDTDIGLPEKSDPGARLEILEVRLDDGAADVRVRTDRRALLVLAENAYPGWEATVDGVSAEVVTADATMLGVVIDAGEHRVSTRFRPRHLRSSIAVTALTLLGSALLWFATTDPTRSDDGP